MKASSESGLCAMEMSITAAGLANSVCFALTAGRVLSRSKTQSKMLDAVKRRAAKTLESGGQTGGSGNLERVAGKKGSTERVRDRLSRGVGQERQATGATGQNDEAAGRRAQQCRQICAAVARATAAEISGAATG